MWENGNMTAATHENQMDNSVQLRRLLNETEDLVQNVQQALGRIGGELERLGIPSWTLPTFSRGRACPELDLLSPRESEVVELFMEGQRVSNIAGILFISQHTVRNHLQSVYRKLGVSSQAELIKKLKGSPRPALVPRELV
jgi:DNA-binding CsgD family transcriptional regulator